MTKSEVLEKKVCKMLENLIEKAVLIHDSDEGGFINVIKTAEKIIQLVEKELKE